MVEALVLQLRAADCQVHGYVLDGYPSTGGQLRALQDRGVVPLNMFELQVALDVSLRRAAAIRASPDRTEAQHDSDEAIAMQTEAYDARKMPHPFGETVHFAAE